MTSHAIPPEEQILKLNRYLIDNAVQLPSPVITVGGQAVMYWYLTYLHFYPDQHDITSITSIDVDYVTRKEGVDVIAKIFNVSAQVQGIFNPPSIAVLSLIDKDTGRVKEDAQGQFLNEPLNEANIVDIIDRPTGFDVGDFVGDKLALNTEPFLVMPDRHGAAMSHEFVRVLNPVACIRSRLSNAIVPMGKDRLTEAERIRVLALPVFNFLLEKLQTLPFRQGRRYVDYFISFIWDRSFRRFQAEHRIPLFRIVEQLVAELEQDPEHEVPPEFYQEELSRKVDFLTQEYQRYLRMVEVRQDSATSNRTRAKSAPD
ncbi:hypothetical protein [Pantoea vagans]|uniref:hypothetical protein n=1 Tax=Pantoea vagans TaxID=470934 RepID=UPI0010936B2A|nr:hypothetical protein [Pantoea vagans]QCA05857.1 hypothetical protein EGO56_17535 [Pantoea vagans]